MYFHFENLGLLDQADLELADLTLVCGENNTGKTYATYAVYGFLRSWRGILRYVLEEEIDALLKDDDQNRIDLAAMFHGKVDDYLARLGREYVSGLPRAFATDSNVFEHTVCVPSTCRDTDLLTQSYQRRVQSGPSGKVLATLNKEAGSAVLEVLVADAEVLQRPFGGLSDFIADAIADIVFAQHLPRVHIASAERTGAAIFRKELDMARTRMLKRLNEIDSKELKRNPFKLLQEIEADYAWPVEDNVEFVRQLEDIDKYTGDLAKEHPELLDVGFYLRCRARAGDLFIIDEPELNLHPKNQRAFARLVARMVNSGIKVFITTHSDYLIKELNTLIMLNQRTEHTRRVQQQYGYSDAELLNPIKARLYMTGTAVKQASGTGRRGKIRTLKLATIYPDRGIEVETFDDTIETMNTIQSEILYGGDL